MEILHVVGLVTVLYVAGVVLRFLWIQLLRPATDLRNFGAKKQGWAVVTGASDGIGKGFAVELAKKGFNLVLVSRTEAKLKEIVAQVGEKYNVKAEYVAVDVQKNSAAVEVVEFLRGKNLESSVSLLVNNVGVNSEIPTELSDITAAEVDVIINVNVAFTTKLTSLLVPLLKKSASDNKRRSAIINLGSILGMVPAGLNTVYGGTKAYLDQFSKCLSAEVQRYRIDVLSVTPYYVMSNISGFKKPSLTVITPNQCAKDSLRLIGATDSVSPNFIHAVIQSAILALPSSLVGSLITSTMQGIRSKKLARAAAGGEKKSKKAE